MGLEFEIWPTAIVDRYIALARAAAGEHEALDAREIRRLEAQAGVEVEAWDSADTAAFLRHVLRSAGLVVAPTRPASAAQRGTRTPRSTSIRETPPQPAPRSTGSRTAAPARPRAPRQTSRRREVSKPANPLDRVRPDAEHVDWSRPLGHLLVIGPDFGARYVECGEGGALTWFDIAPHPFSARRDGSWRIVDTDAGAGLELTLADGPLTTEGTSFRAAEVDLTGRPGARRGHAEKRPFVVLPVLGVTPVPPVETGLRRMLVAFSRGGAVAHEIVPDGRAWGYRLSAAGESITPPRSRVWWSDVRDIFDRGDACLILADDYEWTGRKVPGSGILTGAVTIGRGEPVNVTTVMAFVPLSLVGDFQAAFRHEDALRHAATEAAVSDVAPRPAAPTPPVPPTRPFWALVPEERDVHDETGRPIFRVGPRAWALVTGERRGAFVIRHEDGRVGLLHDTSNVVRG